MLPYKNFLSVCLVLSFLIFAFSITAQEDMTEAHKETVRQLYTFDTDTGYASDYVHHGYGEDMNLEQYRTWMDSLRAAMPDLQATIEILIAEEDWAASRVRFSGTFENEWETIPPTGEMVEWTANILYRFNEDGQVVEEFTAFDRLDLPMATPLPGFLAIRLERTLPAPVTMTESVSEGMEEAHKAAFTSFIEAALNNGDLSAIDTYMAEDYLTHEPFGEFTREEFKQIIAGFREAVPDLHVEIEALVAEGDWLAARLVYTGTFSNPISSEGVTIEPTGEPIRFVIHVFVRFNEEGIGIEDFKEYNRLGWLQQGGVLPAES